MSDPLVVLAVVALSVCGLLVLLMFGAAMMTAFYPDDLNDHKDN